MKDHVSKSRGGRGSTLSRRENTLIYLLRMKKITVAGRNTASFPGIPGLILKLQGGNILSHRSNTWVENERGDSYGIVGEPPFLGGL